MATIPLADAIISTLPEGPGFPFWTLTFSIFNVLLSLSIVWRLFSFTRRGAKHRYTGGVLAMLMMVFYMWTPFLFVFGRVAVVDWATIGINCIIFVAVWRARGNVMQLFKS